MAEHSAAPKVRVLHFVTGGFSGGATQVAVSLVKAAQEGPDVEPLLVLRKKMRTDPRRVQELIDQGLPVATVPGVSHLISILALVKLCKAFKPDVLVAHGFSEHLWGRYAGLIAKVPHLVHVEHNTKERYTTWRLMQSRWLAKRTDAIVGCSEGVKQSLLGMQLPAEKIIAIPNGIQLEPFAQAAQQPYADRAAQIVMVSRFAKQKDHATLLQALALLKHRGLTPQLMLAGKGKARYIEPLKRLCQQLGIEEQVRFLGLCRTVPQLLMSSKIAVLSTHYEGMPLSLLEGMAAGCAVIGSKVPGVQEVIEHGTTGILAEHANPIALADALQELLEKESFAQQLASNAMQVAWQEFSKQRMNERYNALFIKLVERDKF
ncbi:glycosyltransferase [Alkalimonas sp.]|uniref:glycosyltransferase n=1 Tax=Alkalimonas sp. TaxID=1872453 RepID=UPI00263B23A7|nr:glycosyltransferase [Alkalimonas sp.]MCC5826156.1 glycosyltransferase [Alkalimonas sp.]